MKLAFSASWIFIFFLICPPSHAQVYKASWKMDAPLLSSSFGLALGTSIAIPRTQILTLADIAAADANDVNGFDRFATTYWSPRADHVSDVGLVIGLVAPAALLGSKNGRSELGTIALMVAEGGFATLGLTNFTKITALRTRPFVYNAAAPLQEKLDVDARFSFFSGHTSLTTFGAFFTAKVLHDLHPEANWRVATWSGAAAISALTGYLRIRAGRHFPTDVLAGLAVGAGIGWLVPQIHKSKAGNLSLYPAPQGLGMAWRF